MDTCDLPDTYVAIAMPLAWVYIATRKIAHAHVKLPSHYLL